MRIKSLCVIAAALALILLVVERGKTCDITVAEASKTLDRDSYYVVYVYNSPGEDKAAEGKIKETTDRVKNLVAKYSEKVNVDFYSSSFEKLSKDEQKSMKEEFKIEKFPATLVVRPFGKLLYKKDGEITDEDIKKLVYSPVKKEIAASAGKFIAVALCIAGKKAKEKDEVMKNLKKAVDLSENIIGGKIKILEIDPADEKEKCLLDNLGITPDDKQVYTTLVFGRGKARPPIKGGIPVQDIVEYIQLLSNLCSCSFDWRTAGEDLLMEELVKPKKPEGAEENS